MSKEFLATPIEDELDGLFGQYTRANQAKGLVYGLIGPGGLAHSRGFGVVNDAGTIPDLDTIFPIASITKSFVACAALLARDRGLIELERPITAYLPSFNAQDPRGESYDPPTVRMLLCMAGGLTEDNAWIDPFLDTPVDKLLAAVAEGLTYSNPPGSVYEYSNLGFTLAGLAVGNAVGRHVEAWVRDELLAPLGLHSTWFDNDASRNRTMPATGYFLDPHGNWTPYPPKRSDAFAGAGGMQSTVRDLAAWVTWLGSALRPPIDDQLDRVVSRASRREMQRLHQLDRPELAAQTDGSWRVAVGGYGLGLRISEHLHRGTIVSHRGGLPGFTLAMIWHPDSGHGIVVLTNSHRGNPAALAEQALFRVLDREQAAARTVRLWPATIELRQAVERLIRQWDDALATQIFAENIDFDRPLTERRAEIERLIDTIGPLDRALPVADIVSAATPAEITWAIPARRGELVCMVHLTPTRPARIQRFEVAATPFDRPRSARLTDIAPRGGQVEPASLSALPNTQVVLPKAFPRA